MCWSGAYSKSNFAWGECPKDIFNTHVVSQTATPSVIHSLERRPQIIEGAERCVCGIFAATNEEFNLIFAPGIGAAQFSVRALLT